MYILRLIQSFIRTLHILMHTFGVSIKRVVLAGGLNFILISLAGFPLSREPKEFPFRNMYMWIMIFTMMFSGGLIPLYLTVQKLRLMDTIWALVLPGAVSVFNLILVVNFFRNVPKEILECASIDGAGPWTKLFKVMLPLSLPVMATIMLYTIVGNWNASFDGLIFMNKTENYPLQTYIQQLVVTIDPTKIRMDRLDILQNISDRTLNAAKLVVTMVPIICIYPFLQKYFITGITLGSVKE